MPAPEIRRGVFIGALRTKTLAGNDNFNNSSRTIADSTINFEHCFLDK